MDLNSLSTRERALCLMLQPIVRYWIQGSETLQRFSDLLKIIFVEVAVEELNKKKSRVNVSRLSVMTGVHRTDVSKIYNDKTPPERALPDILTRIIGKWSNHPNYTTKQGKPRVLSTKGEDSEFGELVASISKSIRPGAVQSELIRCGAGEKTSNGLKLVKSIIRHSKDYDRSMNLLSRDIHTLIRAVEENVKSDEVSPNLHLSTSYDNIFFDDLPKIREWLRREGKKLHKRARDYLSKFDGDLNENPDKLSGAKVTLTAFSFIDEGHQLEANPPKSPK